MSASAPDLRLYNTLTRTKEHFVPLDPGNVRMYVCGPTVYDDAHIGNARPAIVFDLLFRLLRQVFGPDHVTYVRNITDVDDKINARAAERGISIRQLTEETNARYQADTRALGCLAPDVQPRATEHIGEMVAMIDTLIEGGHAYVANEHVLFDVHSWRDDDAPAYGKLSRRDLEDMRAGARVEIADYKRDPMDFVLWKPSNEDEPGWPSPGGIARDGRPGWHIECSAMSAEHLGEVFDIHGGGLDLIFPHHENEIAQSRCAHGTQRMAQIWMHNGFLQVEGRKMAKSEGNFVTINDLHATETFGGRRWPGEVLRLAMLMTHYREPIDFSRARLEEAEAKLRDWQRVASTARGGAAPDASLIAALSDDLGFHRATTVLDVMARKANRGDNDAADCLASSLALVGLPAASLLESDTVDTRVVAQQIEARLDALKDKRFEDADVIRAQLLAQGIQLMDYKDPESGEKRTKWEAM